jgi:hypothetical protein
MTNAGGRHHHRSATTSLATGSQSDSLAFRSAAKAVRPALNKRRSSLPSSFTPLDEIREDEEKLLNVNQQIKTTLTELLNCESVKGDRSYRMWIQSRLMAAERELKVNRSHRRQSLDVDIQERAVI